MAVLTITIGKREWEETAKEWEIRSYHVSSLTGKPIDLMTVSIKEEKREKDSTQVPNEGVDSPS